LGLLKPGQSAEITGEDYTHLTRSLRAKIGERLRLVDESGAAFEGVLSAADRKKAVVLAETVLPAEAPQAELCLGLCAPSAEAFDAALDAAVQLGVSEFAPLRSSRSKAPDPAKRARWERIAKESCGQSLRTRLPRILDPQPLESFLLRDFSGAKWLAQQEGSAAPAGQASGPLSLLVGPEGGFEDAELELAKKAGWQFLKLAPAVLRVPVAVSAALAVAQQRRMEGK
jgi:16S rRNA (uracil1498-N3)-methyltransferase